MKKTLLLVATTIYAFNSFSQITLDDTDLGNLNDSVLLSNAQSFTANFAATGAGFSWDFTSLTPNSQHQKAYQDIQQVGALGNLIFGQFAAAKYQASYYFNENNPILTLAGNNLPVAIESFNRVVKKTADSLTWIGIVLETGQGAFPVKSGVIESRYVFPLEFGQTHSSEGYTYLDMNPMVDAIWIERRTISSEVDGWGTLSSPYNDYQVIRIHHDIIQSDSIKADLQGTGTPTWAPIPSMHIHEYEWWAKSEKDPVMKITTQEIFGFEVIQSIEYRDLYHPEVASVVENNIDFTLAPNPSSSSTTIYSDYGIESLKLLSMDGRILQEEKEINAKSYTIDVSAIPAGLYFIELVAGGQLQKRTFIHN